MFIGNREIKEIRATQLNSPATKKRASHSVRPPVKTRRAPPRPSPSTSSQPPGLFPKTNWPAITYSPAAAEEKRARAPEQVCRDYWRPVFLLIRARGLSLEEAEDLTQGFWLRFFQSDALSRAHPDKGRFRDFLLGAVRHYLADQCDRERTQRRGGGAPHLSLDAPQAPPLATGAAGLEEEPRGCAADRAWAEAILARALVLLETKYQRPGRRELFRALRPGLLGEGDAPPPTQSWPARWAARKARSAAKRRGSANSLPPRSSRRSWPRSAPSGWTRNGRTCSKSCASNKRREHPARAARRLT